MEPALLSPPDRPAARTWTDALFAPIPIAPIVAFRVIFGLILAWEIERYFAFGWIHSHFQTGRLAFKYFGFEWVHAWPGCWLHVHFAIVGLAALAIAAGFLYRAATIVCFVGFTYTFLLDQIYYLNHLYLVCLLAFLMIFLPASRALSIDAWLRPERRASEVPAWTLLLIRFQLGIVYFFGGVAKLNADWLRGEPVRHWLAGRADLPVVGPFLQQEVAVWMVCYGGLLLDLFVVPMLLWRRTRWLAVLGLVFFHLSNSVLFHIGIFPWIMLASTVMFFPVAWWARVNAWIAGGAASTVLLSRRRGLTMGLLGGWALVQVLLPLRHWLYPGSVHWTEEGHRFSWHMKLRGKKAYRAEFRAFDPDTGREWRIRPERYIPLRELSRAATRPDMVLQLAHAISRDLQAEGHPNVEVHALVVVGLNDHAPQSLIDPNVDLGREPRTLWPAKWILPLRTSAPASRPVVPDDSPE